MKNLRSARPARGRFRAAAPAAAVASLLLLALAACTNSGSISTTTPALTQEPQSTVSATEMESTETPAATQ